MTNSPFHSSQCHVGWIGNRANMTARLAGTGFGRRLQVLVEFSSVPLVCRVLSEMNESLSVEETSSAPRKRRGKYRAVFDCNNSVYDVNGTRTSYHFFKFPKDAQQRNRWCSLIKRRHGQDDFVVSATFTVLQCHDHFWAEDISKKLSGCWNLKKGFWYCRASHWGMNSTTTW